MTTPTGRDRRRHERLAVVRACKVRDRRGLLFSPGHTTNVSCSGALLRLERGRVFNPGERVEVALPRESSPGVVRGRDLVSATVRRVSTIDHNHQAVAVEFEGEQQAMALAA